MKLIASLVFIYLSVISFGQTQGVAYTAVGRGVSTTFVTDYHSLGINSSALGWGNRYDKKFTTGSTEFNFGIYSDSLNVDKLRKLYKAIRNEATGGNDPATWEEQKQYAKEYAESGIAMDASFNWLGFSYYSEKFGGLAFNINEQYSWYSRLNEETSEIVFQGKFANYFDSLTVVFGNDTSRIANYDNMSNDTLAAVILGTISDPLSLSAITNGSSIQFTWNRNYNVGYGRKLFGDSTFALYAGVGARYIQSMAMMTLESSNGEITAYSSFNPNYDIDYGSVSFSNPSTFTQEATIPRKVGDGYGIDLSVSARLLKIFKVGAAVNNIGQVKYTRNVYKVRDSLVGDLSLNGLDEYNVVNSAQQLLETGGLLSLEGQEEFVVKNAANFRVGGSVEFGRFAEIGIDIVAPFNADNPGSLANAIYSVGGDIRPLKWLQISAGYYGGGLYKHNIPVGVNFIFGGGTYEMGIASRDALSFFLDNSNSISTAFGFARVRF